MRRHWTSATASVWTAGVGSIWSRNHEQTANWCRRGAFGFAEYLKTPGVNLCKVPDHVPLEHACILRDAVATSYHAITRRAQVRPGTTPRLVADSSSVSFMGMLVDQKCER